VTSTLAAGPRAPAPGRARPVPESPGAVASGALTVMVGLAGVVVGVAAVFHRFAAVDVNWLIPLLGLRLGLDPLGGFFVAVTGAVAVPVGVYLVGYARAEHLPRTSRVATPIFVAAMLLVGAAGSVTTFLLGWELMALTSLVLVLTAHRRAEARAAGVFYAVLTQLGFAAILLALMLLSAAARADTLAGLAEHVDRVSPGVRGLVLVLTLVGFGSKAGLVPLHAWLPRAHPEAPSPVSALMSAAMVNLGVYGLVRFDLQLLGPGPRWWGVMLLIVGGLSAVYGVLQASVATDLKRLLAYSTTENMGLIVLALGAAGLLAADGARNVAAIALTAALLHVLAHAAFKTLAFLAAGSVLAGTGLRDLDRMGGLARRMPATTVLFGLAALGACGLPLGAGFVSEWLLVQALIHAPRHEDATVGLAMPLAVGVVALSTGLAVVAMVKAFGVGFLARPRSPEAEQAREASPSMLTGMAAAGAACAVLAVSPLLVGGVLRRVLAAVPLGGRSATDHVRLDATLRLPGAAGSIAPGWLAVALLIAIAVAAGLSQWGARRRPASAVVPLWACGASELTPRMQYTATSFAEPLQRVFDDVLRPDTDVEISHHAESRYLVDKVTFRAALVDTIEHRLYRPVERGVHAWAGWVRRAHSGSVHLYLGYGAIGLLVVLVLAR
jgi:hydrogenase-4 component B